MRRDADWLHDIIEAIEKLERPELQDERQFFSNELLQVWAQHHLQIIGEASSHLSENIRNKYPLVPWAQIVAMRNVLAHNYFGIDLEEIRDTLQNDVPLLRRIVLEILKESGK